MEQDVLRFLDDAPAIALPDPVEFLGDRRLPVRPHRPAGMRLGVDEERLAVLPGDEAAVMRMALAVHPLSGPRIAQDLDRAEFEHAGADALEHMRSCLALDDDTVEPESIKQVRQKEAGRAAPDDRDLGARHVRSLSVAFTSPTPTGPGCSSPRRARLERDEIRLGILHW